MVNEIVSRFIASLCYSIDRTCRHDLQANRIVSERDYVSNLGTHLRFPLGPFCEFNLALATTLNGGLERIFGCDSILIFRHRNEVKIGIFEAKWPRFFTQQNYPWDSLSKKNNDSRFSSQIIRQQNWNASGLTIWEMFFNESLPGTNHVNWDDLGSTCVLHTDASNYFHTIMSGNQFQLWTEQVFQHPDLHLFPATSYLPKCR